jgi:hypothetical protein
MVRAARCAVQTLQRGVSAHKKDREIHVGSRGFELNVGYQSSSSTTTRSTVRLSVGPV